VFLLPADLAPFGWNAVVGWALTIAGSLCLAFVISRMTLAMPDDGGAPGFVARAFGPVPGFLVGWAYWVSIWTTNVTLGVATISYLSLFVPALGQHSALATLALVWAVTLINLRGARAAGGFQAVTLLIKLVPLIAVIVLIAAAFAKGTATVTPFPTEGLSATAINGSAILTLWAMLGFESASVANDKVADPARTIPRATMAGTVATGIIYLITCSGIALMLPAGQVTGSPAPFSVFVERYWAHGPALWIALFAAISALGSLNGWILLQGSLPASMARRGMLPGWLGVETQRGVPARALIVASLISSVFILLNADKSTGKLFTLMATLSTSATLWLYVACAAAALRFRIAMPVAVLGLIYAVWTIWGADVSVSLLSFILMIAGLPLYLLARRSAPAPHPAP
jgi:APA family basic amino acid/polyamine antiporter